VIKINSAFLERYQLDFRDENTIEGVLARDPFIALKWLAKDFGVSFNMNSRSAVRPAVLQRPADDPGGSFRNNGQQTGNHRAPHRYL